MLQTKITGGNIQCTKKPKDVDYVTCPVCHIEINSTLIHLHIDSCLLKATEVEEHSPYLPENKKESPLYSIETSALPDDIRLEEMTEVPGLWLVHNFISEEEEEKIVHHLDNDPTPWHFSSFNGNCNSKAFGVKTQFGAPGSKEERCVRRNNPALGEFDIPSYLDPYPVRLQSVVQQALSSQQGKLQKDSLQQDSFLGLSCQRKNLPPTEIVKFVPNECNVNSYEAQLKHYLRPHFDDRTLSGPILMNLSLNCDSRMTYHLANSNNTYGDSGGDGSSTSSTSSPIEQEFKINLPRRTLQLVTGPARWKYRHSIKAEDVLGKRRVSITWRKSQSKSAGIRHQAVSRQDERVRNSKQL